MSELMLDFKQLRYFVAIAESTSFSKAAQKLYISQPALSQQISKLEQQLGVSLINRSNRIVRLTPAGQEFYRHALQLLNSMENMVNSVLTADSSVLGNQPLNICLEDGIFSLDGTGVYDFFNRLTAANPELNINFHPARLDSFSRLLSDGEADIGIAFVSGSALLAPNLEEHCFHKGYLALAVPKSWHCSANSPEFAKLLQNSTLYYPHSHTGWHNSIIGAISSFNAHPHSANLDNYETALNYVASGSGIMFAPEIHLQSKKSAYFDIIPLQMECTQYRVSAFYRRSHAAILQPILSLLPAPLDREQTESDFA